MFAAAKTDLQNDIAHGHREQRRNFNSWMFIQVQRECRQNARNHFFPIHTEIVVPGTPEQILTECLLIHQGRNLTIDW